MSILYLVEYIHRVAQNDDDNGNATVHAWLGVRFRIKQNKNYIERPLESEHLKFMSPRMSHYTCLLSDHDRLFKVGKALGQTSIHCFFSVFLIFYTPAFVKSSETKTTIDPDKITTKVFPSPYTIYCRMGNFP